MKKAGVLLISLAISVLLCGCNRQLFDVIYQFDYAIVQLPNGEVVEGKVQSWKDFEDGDQIQVKINGVTYLVHSSNVVLEAR